MSWDSTQKRLGWGTRLGPVRGVCQRASWGAVFGATRGETHYSLSSHVSYSALPGGGESAWVTSWCDKEGTIFLPANGVRCERKSTAPQTKEVCMGHPKIRGLTKSVSQSFESRE